MASRSESILPLPSFPVVIIIFFFCLLSRMLLHSQASGQWQLMLRQNYSAGTFGTREFSKNADNPNSLLFAQLDKLEDYRSEDGKFYLQLRWPGLLGGKKPK